MKVCKNCKHQKKYHGCLGCMDIIIEPDIFNNSRRWICDCVGWNSKGIGVKVLLP